MARAYADLSDLDDVVKEVGAVDIMMNNAAGSIRRPLAESLDRWHDVERVTALNYYAPLRLIRGLAPGMLARGDACEPDDRGLEPLWAGS